MGGQTGSQIDASSTQVAKKAISVRPCRRARTKENKTEANLHLLSLGGQTVPENLASTCVRIWARSKWTQDIANRRNSIHAMAKWSRKLMQVFNFR